MDERYRFVADASASYLGSFTELCAYYGISTKTGYKWLQRYAGEGVNGLQDRSRAAHVHPNVVQPETEEAILRMRRAHPTWGPRKLLVLLRAAGRDAAWPAASTVGEILKRNGLSVPRKRCRRATPSTQPFSECHAANQVWCADYKGWFRTGDGTRCDPLTMTDSYSRYLLRCQAVPDLTFEQAKGVFEAAFRQYGLPLAIRTDNGPPFASTGLGGLSRLSFWWLKLGIAPERIEPGEPQQNGRHERMHLTLKQETASPPAQNIRGQQKRFDAFREEYNQVRPHEALQMRTPAAIYQPSGRRYPPRLRDPEYGAGYEVRRVGDRGEFRWNSTKIGLAYALDGELIGLRACSDRYWKIYFCDLRLATFDSYALRVLTRREAARVDREVRHDG